MSDTKNLSGTDAIDKIRKFAEDKTSMFCTFAGQQMTTRPMHTQAVDEEGAMWFFSEKDSDKNQQIQANPRVQLIYANNSSYEYLAIEGHASIEHDEEMIDELWNEWAKTWFTEGKTDPRLTLIKLIPEKGHYWDTKNNKIISLMKIAAGAIAGKTTDNGVEGDLKP